MSALELVTSSLLHSVSHYGWHAPLNGVINNLCMSAYSGKLALLNKALYAYKPDIPGIEGLLNEEELSMIVRCLKDISSSLPEMELCFMINAREILLITRGVTRIPANCSGLTEKGIEELLQCLMDKNDEKISTAAAIIMWQIATADDESAEVDSTVTALGKYHWFMHCRSRACHN